MTLERTLTFRLDGELPSKKNAWKRGASGKVYIGRDMRSILDDFLWQLKAITAKLAAPIGECIVVAEIYTHTKLPDVDNRYTTLQDLLQKSGVLHNDSNVLEIRCRRTIIAAASKPYVDIEISYGS